MANVIPILSRLNYPVAQLVEFKNPSLFQAYLVHLFSSARDEWLIQTSSTYLCAPVVPMHLPSLSLRSLSIYILALHLVFPVMAMPLLAVDHSKTESMAHLEARAGKKGDQGGPSSAGGTSVPIDSPTKLPLQLTLSKGYEKLGPLSLKDRPMLFWVGNDISMKAEQSSVPAVDRNPTVAEPASYDPSVHSNMPPETAVWKFSSTKERTTLRQRYYYMSTTIIGRFVFKSPTHMSESVPILLENFKGNLQGVSSISLFDEAVKGCSSGKLLPPDVSFELAAHNPWQIFYTARTDSQKFEKEYDGVKAEEWTTVLENLTGGGKAAPKTSGPSQAPPNIKAPTSLTWGEVHTPDDMAATQRSGSTMTSYSWGDALTPHYMATTKPGPSKDPESGSSESRETQAAQGPGATNPTGGTGTSMLTVKQMAGLDPIPPS
ncbi:hypothetical protein FB446DRAFT_833420 [Lentinula raphanica]|nr:hypothetical protein FB446DRAFT_833420 [Lentinula raphanica]